MHSSTLDILSSRAIALSIRASRILFARLRLSSLSHIRLQISQDIAPRKHSFFSLRPLAYITCWRECTSDHLRLYLLSGLSMNDGVSSSEKPQ